MIDLATGRPAVAGARRRRRRRAHQRRRTLRASPPPSTPCAPAATDRPRPDRGAPARPTTSTRRLRPHPRRRAAGGGVCASRYRGGGGWPPARATADPDRGAGMVARGRADASDLARRTARGTSGATAGTTWSFATTRARASPDCSCATAPRGSGRSGGCRRRPCASSGSTSRRSTPPRAAPSGERSTNRRCTTRRSGRLPTRRWPGRSFGSCTAVTATPRAHSSLRHRA